MFASVISRCVFVFQSAPPAKGAIEVRSLAHHLQMFQSAPPAKGAMGKERGVALPGMFQSAPPAKGAIGQADDQGGRDAVSIRAPREGGDHCRRDWLTR